MYGIERQEKILSLLSENVSISVNKLSKLLYVSQPTVRRDLSELERQKKVIRTHGGVVIRNAPDNEIPLLWREEQNNASKKKISEKAAGYIHNGDIIFMDASSTVSYIIPHLKSFTDIIVVTNSPKISLKLGEERIKNYCAGGLLLQHSIAYIGSEAEAFVSHFNADIFFFSSRGYTEGGFITDSSAEEACVKKQCLKIPPKAFIYAIQARKIRNTCITSAERTRSP